jgi:predicted ATP-grasp superfamily ATP-dependent carboligase
MAWLGRNAHALQGSVLLPCNDEALELIAGSRDSLVQLGYRPFEANDDVVLAMLDKGRTYDLARRLGVPVPCTWPVRSAGAIEEAASRIGFPLALKPVHSHVLARHRGWPKVIVVNDVPQLADVMRSLQAMGVDALATEIIPGGDDQFVSYYSYIDDRGEPLLHFTKRKIRQYPPGFGLITYQVTEWDPEAAALGLRFFQGIGLRGLANVEFKRDARDGKLKLIECNHRFTAANEIVRRAGMDLAVLTYNRALGRATPAMDSFREGLRMWDPVDDTRAFLAMRRDRQLSFGSWFLSLLHRTHMPLLCWDDPRPALIQLARLGRGLGRRGRLVKTPSL